MIIATTYENGEVFQHFGHTQEFKLYSVDDGVIVSTEVISTDGSGHGALAALLDDCSVNVLICGSIGGGAQSALSEAGIDFVSGVTGDADAAVEAYLRGELVSAGVNCDHHGHDKNAEEADGENCGCDCSSGDCGEQSGCGGCGGGCHGRAQMPEIEGENVGRLVKVHYRGTFNDGTEFDSSYSRNETLDFVCGIGQMILGFDKAVAKMQVGETVNIHLMPEEAYGPKDPAAIIDIAISDLPGSEELSAGQEVYLEDMFGRPFKALVVVKDDEHIVLDTNHEMAGKELNFEIKLIEVS